MAPMEFLGNLLLLIVGGNDTTRNSISGGVLAMNEYPGELDKVKAEPHLIPIWCQRSSVGKRHSPTCGGQRLNQ